MLLKRQPDLGTIATGPKVYIACPYTLGDKELNVTNAMHMDQVLWDMGFVPFNPLLSHFTHQVAPRSYEAWLAYDMRWMIACDAVYRIPGESRGADAEERLARQLGIPVFYDLDQLQLWGQDSNLRPGD
jgi:Domain of unknown function (DUF4406)